MVSYVYEVRVGLADDAQPDPDTTTEILRAVDADAILAQPGNLSVSGSLDEDNVLEAGETMRGVLNRSVVILKGHGFVPVSEGWDIREDEGDNEGA